MQQTKFVVLHNKNGKQVNAYLHRHYSGYFLGQNEVSTLLHILNLQKGLEESLTTFHLLKSRGENKFCYLTTIPTGFMWVTNWQQNKYEDKHEKRPKINTETRFDFDDDAKLYIPLIAFPLISANMVY